MHRAENNPALTSHFLLLRVSLFIICIFCLPAATYADSLKLQRERYLAAKQALRSGRVTQFKQITSSLRDYPLYPYLLYDYLRPRLWKLKESEIAGFLKQYGDLPMANDIRRAWLLILAKRQRWQAYLQHYTPQQDTRLKCYQLLARIKTKRNAYLLEDTRSVWLSGESQPPQCDPAFALLYKSKFMTTELVWQRVRLAMEQGESGLAKYLSRRLSPADQKWVARWIAIHANPAKWTWKPAFDDVPVAREILQHGIRRLARSNIKLAIPRWVKLKSNYAFADGTVADVEKYLAVRAAQEKLKQAIQLLDQLEYIEYDEQIFNHRLRTALAYRNWDLLLKWTEGKPPLDENTRQRWLYWRARALMETDQTEEAVALFREAAKNRDYYAFLAADRLEMDYDLNYHPLPEDLETWHEIANRPAVVRARELYLLGMAYSARREWHHVINHLTSYQMQIAAMVAANWGWHDRVILALGKARAYDDLVLRFPMPYKKNLQGYAARRHLDLAWVYALTRAESAFMEDARSPTGALGLMQVMPRTGRATARSIGYRKFSTAMLLSPKTNISIGTAYLRQMLDRFNGNMILATAAYNAGPSNVGAWLSSQACVEPDIWIELIPFDETRKYVRRILYFASIYDWRLQKEIRPVKTRMALVQPRSSTVVASLSCSDRTLAVN